MSNRYNHFLEKLRHTPVSKEEFFRSMSSMVGLYADLDTEYEILKASGLPLVEDGDMIFFSTMCTPYREQRFCIVDIETNGSTPTKDQVIELGAILYQNGEILDTFESRIFCKEIPEYITKITGITQEDLQEAPMMKDVLAKFRIFLGDAVFVAHNVSFDYPFLSAMMKRSGLEMIQNRKLCTIDLARKTIQSDRYGLAYLNEFLGINTQISHRAYADALTALRVFEEALKHIPQEILTTEQLIAFSSHGTVKKNRRSKTRGQTRDQGLPNLCKNGASDRVGHS